ncbi:hypothetical protein EYF80_055603 [Liparis tanakae]|uniref:Uncharacterized protein n=1 Tax=Liparis tanakae TaxID=230148 RepID=A0A4Z2EZ45_9TELE|nr:hypothetical protein EYF80_055603 [Liparis tanakae]
MRAHLVCSIEGLVSRQSNPSAPAEGSSSADIDRGSAGGGGDNGVDKQPPEDSRIQWPIRRVACSKPREADWGIEAVRHGRAADRTYTPVNVHNVSGKPPETSFALPKLAYSIPR